MTAGESTPTQLEQQEQRHELQLEISKNSEKFDEVQAELESIASALQGDGLEEEQDDRPNDLEKATTQASHGPHEPATRIVTAVDVRIPIGQKGNSNHVVAMWSLTLTELALCSIHLLSLDILLTLVPIILVDWSRRSGESSVVANMEENISNNRRWLSSFCRHNWHFHDLASNSSDCRTIWNRSDSGHSSSHAIYDWLSDWPSDCCTHFRDMGPNGRL